MNRTYRELSALSTHGLAASRTSAYIGVVFLTSSVFGFGAARFRARDTLVLSKVTMADIAALTALIEPESIALGMRLVRVGFFGGKSDPTLQVMAERPDTRQLTLDDCAVLSRRLSEVLDALDGTPNDPIDEAYRLEVSSPGIDRPLTRLSDYTDWAGHEARIKLVEPIEGRKMFDADLTGVEGEDVLVVAKHGAMQIPFAAIATAKLILTDKLIKATKPLDAHGADKIIEEEVN